MPSLLSGGIVTLGALAVLGYDAWLYLSHNQQYYDVVFGPYGLKSFGWQPAEGFSAWKQLFFASSVSYYIVLLAVATAVGLLTFSVLQLSGLVVRSSVELLQTARDKEAAHKRAREEMIHRLLLRMTSLVGWALYAAATVSVLLPASVILSQIGVEEMLGGKIVGLVLSVAAFITFVLVLHLHAIFMRLVVLRPRVFGGENDIIEAETAR
jgi:hypothetical protein